jgi:predicted SprT family Zn-dependent metalloprotease
MDLVRAHRLATDTIEGHGIYAPITWNNARTAAGACKFYAKGPEQGEVHSFVFSRPIFRLLDDDAARNVITHELAHALAGLSAGHGYEWKRIHLSLGGDGKRCHEDDEIVHAVSKWKAECRENRKVIATANRLSERKRRSLCSCHRKPVLWIENR